MRLQLGNILKIIIVGLALGLSNCGKKSKSQDVKLSVLPERPLVITGKGSQIVNGSVVTVNPPWFRFQLTVDNETSPAEPVTIVSIHVEVTGVDASGSPVTKTADFDPSVNDYTDSVTNAQCNYSDFGVFTPGAPAGDPLTGAEPFNGIPLYSVASTSGCNKSIPIFYVGDLPQVSIDQTSYSYTIKITPLGWFGTRTSQVERFGTSVYTYNQ